MTLKAYIWGMRFFTFFSFIALGFVVVYIDPDKSGQAGLALFYLVFFLTISSVLNLCLLFVRRKILGDELAAENVGLSFRQSILLGLIFLGLLILQGLKALVWWDALLVVAAVFLVELYFLSRS